MIPTQEMTAYPTFGDNASKVKPDDAKYAAGFEPGDVVPAEWLNWLLNRGSSATTKLNAGTLSMEQEINNVLQGGNQTPDQTETNQLLLAIQYIINQVRLDEQQRPAVGVPTLWLGSKPDWALDFGNGASTKYLWANYPKLNNDKFKNILFTLSGAGWMTAHDTSGFYVPDLRGVVPIGYGTNAKRTGETTSGGTLGQYLISTNKAHKHTRGDMEIAADNIAAGGTSSYSQTSFSASGAASWTSSEPVTIGGGNSWLLAIYKGDFRASRNWTGSTSQEGINGQASKPASIGCMWIVRFE